MRINFKMSDDQKKSLKCGKPSLFNMRIQEVESYLKDFDKTLLSQKVITSNDNKNDIIESSLGEALAEVIFNQIMERDCSLPSNQKLIEAWLNDFKGLKTKDVKNITNFISEMTNNRVFIYTPDEYEEILKDLED